MPDVIVIGGGVIGLSVACELAGRGRQVTVLDRQQPGQEASWAGAGILPPGRAGDPTHPLAELSAVSRGMWPALSQVLCEETGIDNGFRQCGGLCFSPDGDEESLHVEIDAWQAVRVEVECLSPPELDAIEPAVGSAGGPCYRLPGTAQIRNPWHLKALLAACVRRGVDVQSGQPVIGFERRDDRVAGVRTGTGRLEADQYLVTAGAWSTPLIEGFVRPRRVEPVRGQMILLSTPAPLLDQVLECGPRYLVPRADGLTLVGATEEWVGFEKRNTPAAMRGLLDFAVRMVPGLAEARFERAWSGLRPNAVDGLPLLGQVPGTDNLYIAAGHFRAGLSLSPITARLMSQLMTGELPEHDLTPFAPDAD